MSSSSQNLSSIPLEIRVFVSFLLFLLSIPLGITINGTSYFLLGWIQIFLVQLIIEESRLIGPLAGSTKKKFNYCKISEDFGIQNSNNFYPISQYFETYMLFNCPDIIKCFSYMIGCSRLLRNFALIDICILGYYIVANALHEPRFIGKKTLVHFASGSL